jgi:hypothetical protein
MAFDNKVKVGKMDISFHDIHFRCEQKLLSPFKHQNKLAAGHKTWRDGYSSQVPGAEFTTCFHN